MNYLIEIFDTYGRRIAWFDNVPLLEAVRRRPDQEDVIRGLLPRGIPELGHGYAVRVSIDGEAFAECRVDLTAPEWSDARKLIIDQYVSFHEVIEFSAVRKARDGNNTVARAYQNRPISQIVKDAINSTLGDVHYTVAHTAYPEGAQREYQKFLARKSPANELEVGGIDSGDWVGSNRMDLTNAYAKDGDTIAGITVDGDPWPDVRLMMIDSEETSLNNHAISRHPEVADWTPAQYDASPYKVKADAATNLLQSLIDSKGIDFIELNPHKDKNGNFDDRVDAFGRYIGLVYGGGECFNAAMVEQGLADVLLFEDGAFHVPEMALKDYFSYTGVNKDSIEDASATLVSFDVNNGIYEVLTALAYAAGGYTWHTDHQRAVTFRNTDAAHHVVFFDPVEVGIQLGSRSDQITNFLVVSGNPQSESVDEAYPRGESIDSYGLQTRFLDYFSLSVLDDANAIAPAMLDDIAYPEPQGAAVFFHGRNDIHVGDLIEFRGGDLRRLTQELDDEWGGRFQDRLVARIREVRHRITGRRVETTIALSSPLRSVDDPLTFITRSQPAARSLFQFRLDDGAVGLDLGFHLD